MSPLAKPKGGSEEDANKNLNSHNAFMETNMVVRKRT